MRPLLLKMSAFGPYIYEEIDMNTLGDQGIYLITGDTGAGKTTIFDAITYALYGKASGEIRETNMFRCEYADAKTPTYVELVFEYAGREYCVRRNPEYKRNALKGTGKTKQVAGAELRMPDGKVITKIKDVTFAIEEIMGITCEQFTQISMIAQGEFLKLLHASTEERLTIFRKVFQTANFQKLQFRLKDDAAHLQKEYDRLQRGIEQYINGIICEGELKGFINEVIEDIKKINADDKIRENQLFELLELNQKKYLQIDTLFNRGEDREKKRVELLKVQDEYAGKIFMLDALKNNYNEERDKEEDREELTCIINSLEQNLAKFDKVECLKIDLEKSIEEVKNEEEILCFLKEDIENKEQLIIDAQKEIVNLQEEKLQKIHVENRIKACLNESKEIKRLLNIFYDVENKTKMNQKLQNKYLEISRLAKDLQEQYYEKNQKYLDEQAGVLARNLQKGEPCPVCGSTHHESLAMYRGDAPSKEALEEARKASVEAAEGAREQSEKLAVARSAIENLEKLLLNDVEKYVEDAVEIGTRSLDELKELILEKEKKVEQEQTKLEREYDTLKRQVEKLSLLEKTLPNMQHKVEEHREIFNEQKINKAKNEVSISHLKNKIKEEKELLSNNSKEETTRELTKCKSSLDEMKQRLEETQKKYRNQQSEVDKLKGRKETLSKYIDEIEIVNLDELRNKKIELEVEKVRIQTLCTEISSKLRSNQTNLKNIIDKSVELQIVEEKYQWMKELSDTANGNLSKKEKIMLETFVQMQYFDRIIRRANIRFLKMTGDQYELKRRVDVGTTAGKKGLDLNVIDYYNGSERSVKTLSGGESFKASLALALGLSDEIQSVAGGIKLDTMFVDEGFGSLDEDSLNQAIQILIGLADGERLVGIISHVDELKERIDKQLVIKKNGSKGSSHRIVDRS